MGRPPRSRIMLTAPVGVALFVTGGFGDMSTRAADDLRLATQTLPESAAHAVTPSQALRALTAKGVEPNARFRSNGEISRGVSGDIYSKVGPATVLLAIGASYGTGVIISPDGWILTNQHVIESAPVHSVTGIQVVTVYLGRLQNRVMELQEDELFASVYKVDAVRDLALLKLERVPADVAELPFVRMADNQPEPGDDCAVVGHPRSGMLWTVRSGEVAAIGVWPHDRIDAVVTRLTSVGPSRDELAKTLESAEKRKVVTSTCGINPGDSGSALVNGSGELIGATFAIPRNERDDGISLDKFAYHVHLDEIRQFLSSRPEKAPLFVPDTWPIALVSSLRDKDGNDRADTWLFGMKENAELTGCLVDLDEDSPAFFQDEFMRDPSKRERWDFEFAFQTIPAVRTFYDSDNDGKIDIIFTDANGDGISDTAIRHASSGWELFATDEQQLFDPSIFRESQLQARFIELMHGKSD